MVAKQSTTHIRLPARAETVAGLEPAPGQPAGGKATLDPRTVTQDPVTKQKA